MTSPNKSFRAAILLGLMYAISVMDRQIVALVLEPIKTEMQLSDTQLALMSGLMFAIFYGFMGIPIARLCQRYNRVNILAICLTIWSMMTALSGLAVNYSMLMLSRMGVGIGEAGCQPAGQSLIADYYEPHQRSRALAFFAAGAPIGAAIAYLAGGVLVEHYGWRATLILASVPGFIFALILRFWLTEPARIITPQANNTSIAQQIKFLLNLAPYRFALLGHIACVCLSYSAMIWIPTIIIRSFEISLTQVGLYVGASALIGGIFGSIVSGFIADKLVISNPLWLGRLPMIYCLLAILPFALVLLANNILWFILALTIVFTLISAHTPPTYAAYHHTVDSEHRAMSVAFSTLTVNLMGLGLAPLLVGMASDFLTPQYGAHALKYAMSIGLIYLPLAAWCFYKVTKLLDNAQSEPVMVN